MESSEIRQPTQKRAIEKKDRIIEYGFKLMCEKGYHHVDSIQIAKASDVSTGTVYQYFKDKRDIFVQGLKKYGRAMLFPIIGIKDKKINKNSLYSEIESFIDSSIKNHNLTQIAHEEIMAMKHSDLEVAEIFNDYEIEATEALVEFFKNNNINVEDMYEKAHLIISWTDDLCHELVYHQHENMNYDKMKIIVINSILNLFK